MRYRYDERAGVRLTTVEVVVARAPLKRPRRLPDSAARLREGGSLGEAAPGAPEKSWRPLGRGPTIVASAIRQGSRTGPQKAASEGPP